MAERNVLLKNVKHPFLVVSTLFFDIRRHVFNFLFNGHFYLKSYVGVTK